MAIALAKVASNLIRIISDTSAAQGLRHISQTGHIVGSGSALSQPHLPDDGEMFTMIELAKGLVTLGEWRAATIREALTLQRRFDLLCPGVSEAKVGFTRLSSACLRMAVSISRPITLQSADA